MKNAAGPDLLGSSTTGSTEPDEYVPTEPFRGKTAELQLQLIERLLSACMQSGRAAREECFRRRLLAGLDSDGTVGTHCPAQGDLDADARCIIVGSLAYAMATRMGKDATSFDWQDPGESARRLARQFVIQQVRDCLVNGAASDPKHCVMTRITQSLDLTASDLEPCNVLVDDDYAYGQCIGETFSHKHVRQAIARM